MPTQLNMKPGLLRGLYAPFHNAMSTDPGTMRPGLGRGLFAPAGNAYTGRRPAARPAAGPAGLDRFSAPPRHLFPRGGVQPQAAADPVMASIAGRPAQDLRSMASPVSAPLAMPQAASPYVDFDDGMGMGAGGIQNMEAMFGQTMGTPSRRGFRGAVRDTGFPADMAARSPALSASFLDAKLGQDPNYRFQMPTSQPTPAALYGDSVRQNGLMTNEQAGQFYNDNADPYTGQRYMPKTTVGGAWGQRSGPHIGSAAVMAGGDPGDILGGMQATTERLLANPDGRWFGGARINPRANSAPGVSTFLGPEQDPGAIAAAEGNWAGAAQRAAAKGLGDFDPVTGQFRGRQTTVDPARQELLEKNRAAYQARRQQELDGRQANVEKYAAQRRDARRARLGNLTVEERILGGVPGAFQAREGRLAEEGRLAALDKQFAEQLGFRNRQLEQEGELGQGELDVRRQAATEQARQFDAQQQQAKDELAFRGQESAADRALRKELGIGEQQNNTRTLEAEYATALMEAGMDQQSAQEEARQFFGGAIGGAPQAPAAGRGSVAPPASFGSLNQKQRDELALMTPAQQRKKLIALGITDPNVRSEILSDLAGGSPWVSDDDPDGYGLSNLFWTGMGGDFIDDAMRGFKNRKGQREFPTLPGVIGIGQRLFGGS